MKKSVSKKNPAAAADKVARAKELKRIRDAKYRAQKKAAKKPQQEDKCDCRDIVRILATTIMTQGLALSTIASDKTVPDRARYAARMAFELGKMGLDMAREAAGEKKHGKEVR